MSLTLLKAVSIFLIFLVTIIYAACALGAALPPNPALSGFSENCQNKPQPCWYGVLPGVTPLSDVLKMFEQRTFQVFEHVNPQLGHNEYVVMNPQDHTSCVSTLVPVGEDATILRLACPEIRLGDMLAAFGKPDAVYGTLLYYHSGLIILIHTFSAYDGIEFIYLNQKNAFPDCTYPWSGFATPWRYQEIAVQRLNC